MDGTDPFHPASVRQFAVAWYDALDVHAPADAFHMFLAGEGMEIVFPERTMRSYPEFDEWLAGIYRTFFDEIHIVQSVTILGFTETTADLEVVVGWQASWFTSPDAKSKRTSMSAVQRWTVQSREKNAYTAT